MKPTRDQCSIDLRATGRRQLGLEVGVFRRAADAPSTHGESAHDGIPKLKTFKYIDRGDEGLMYVGYHRLAAKTRRGSA